MYQANSLSRSSGKRNKYALNSCVSVSTSACTLTDGRARCIGAVEVRLEAKLVFAAPRAAAVRSWLRESAAQVRQRLVRLRQGLQHTLTPETKLLSGTGPLGCVVLLPLTRVGQGFSEGRSLSPNSCRGRGSTSVGYRPVAGAFCSPK